MATTFTPLSKPDRRRLHGFASPGGIVWRDLQDPDREPWTEHRGNAIIAHERQRAFELLAVGGEMDEALTAALVASQKRKAPTPAEQAQALLERFHQAGEE